VSSCWFVAFKKRREEFRGGGMEKGWRKKIMGKAQPFY